MTGLKPTISHPKLTFDTTVGHSFSLSLLATPTRNSDSRPRKYPNVGMEDPESLKTVTAYLIPIKELHQYLRLGDAREQVNSIRIHPSCSISSCLYLNPLFMVYDL